nr:MAG TPA: hypothetical protein [Caudoviricetes sp.]
MDKVLIINNLKDLKKLIKMNINVLTDPKDCDFLVAINEIIIAYINSKYPEQ